MTDFKETVEKLFGGTAGNFERGLKCSPQDASWPGDRPMSTNSFGFFYPGEIKRVPFGEASQKLVKNGDFEWTDEPTNQNEIAGIVRAWQKANPRPKRVPRSIIPRTNTSAENISRPGDKPPAEEPKE